MPPPELIIVQRSKQKALACFYRDLMENQISRFIISKINLAKNLAGFFSLKDYTLFPQKKIKPIFFFFILPLSLNLFPPLSVQAMETIIPVVYLNEEQKGEFFIKMTEDHDFLIKVEDLKEIGLLDPQGKLYNIEGISYLSLKSIPQIKISFDEGKQALKIQAPPEFLAKTVLDFSNKRPKNINYPKDNSFFLNYGIQYSAGTGFRFDNISTTTQLGVRAGNFIFLSDSILSASETETKFNRLMTSITYDDRQRMNTYVFGDLYATSGSLGSCLLLGGLSFSKNYSADPYIIKRPVQGYQGYVNTPSEISIYLNGARIGNERMPAGGFDLRNIMGYNGLQDLDIVIKDAFGREQHIANPFYVSDSLLAKSFHDFSYNIGFLRENIGSNKDQYNDPVFIGFHRYGLTNNLTIGASGEAGSGLYNFAPSVAYGSQLGIFEFVLAGSRNEKEKTGFAGSADYTFNIKRFNARIGATSYSEDYSTLSQATSPNPENIEKPKLEFGAGLGFGTKSFGSMALNYTKTIKYNNKEKEMMGLMYSKGIGQKFSLTISMDQTSESGSDNNKSELGFFVSLTYYPWKETIMTNTGMSGDSFRGNFQIQKNAPIGEGYGYRAAVDMRNEKDGLETSLRPYFQYNGMYGIYSTEVSAQFGRSQEIQTYQFNASGAVVYVGNSFGFTRPIDDSFALVKVAQVPGVRVYHNNQEIGKTDQFGKLVVPNFHSYDANQIRIDDKDIPLDYAITDVTRYISPAWRTGTLVKFEAKKVQAFTGRLLIEKEGKILPLEYHRITMKLNGKTLTFQTGRDGEFFIEDALAGSFKASFKYEGKVHTFDINIPKSDEIIIDAGEIHVQVQP